MDNIENFQNFLENLYDIQCDAQIEEMLTKNIDQLQAIVNSNMDIKNAFHEYLKSIEKPKKVAKPKAEKVAKPKAEKVAKPKAEKVVKEKKPKGKKSNVVVIDRSEEGNKQDFD